MWSIGARLRCRSFFLLAFLVSEDGGWDVICAVGFVMYVACRIIIDLVFHDGRGYFGYILSFVCPSTVGWCGVMWLFGV
ncbi:hypothetical protein DFP73DRAFT_554438 [Morchella snyderi]|nr:hypothetical protein DFP73DRAFT_554438 [Morchella snyderi]